jgi:hypothetical protein
MSYRTVFDISQRFPDCVMGAVALLGLVMLLAVICLPVRRTMLRQRSWFPLVAAGCLFSLLSIHIIAIPAGLVVGLAVGALVAVLGLLAAADVEFRLDEKHTARARTAALVAAVAILLVSGLQGAGQWSAFDLSHRLADGNATVFSGTVEKAGGGGAWGWECFTVEGREFCYGDDSSYVGFHQTAANGGPIHNGLRVRVSSVGDVIVRLEIADEH